MSAAVRASLADAVSTVEGVTCSPYFRQTTRTGHAMVRLDRMSRASNGFGFVNTWQVLVILPDDIAAAERWLEAHIGALIDAVSEHAVIGAVTPSQLVLEGGNNVPAVVIEATRESEN